MVTYAVDCYPEDASGIGVCISFVRQMWGFIGPFCHSPAKGPSSNHALFSALTAKVVNLGYRAIGQNLESSPQGQDNALQDQPQLGEIPRTPHGTISSEKEAGIDFPKRQEALELITLFFDTVGAVTPLISEPTLLRQVNEFYAQTGTCKMTPRDVKALLSIVFAHAAATKDDLCHYAFYSQAVAFLNDKTAHLPSIVSRMLTATEIMNDEAKQGRLVNLSRSREDLVYFRHLISLHQTMGVAIDSIYSSNISSSNNLILEDLVLKTMDLSRQLDSWYADAGSSRVMVPALGCSLRSTIIFDNCKHDIMLTIYYYRAVLLVNGPLLVEFVQQ
ncbi:hypothetical protein QQX98_000847 [Neonectria punicea]|uniref:Uncharacterized protein n=1 Tax=Neonectria punicea TaxID=979145 RepID=A0ABR1HR44_9HYPO